MAKQMHVNLLNMMNWSYSISNFWKGMVQQAVFVLQEVTVAVEIQECEFKGFFFFSLFLFGFYDFQTILKQLHVHRQTTLSIPCLGPLIFPAQQQLLSDLLCLNVSQQFFFFFFGKELKRT